MRVLLHTGDPALTRSVTAELLGHGHELHLLGGGRAFHASLPASVRTTGIDAADGRATDMLLATIRPDAVVLLPTADRGQGRGPDTGALQRALAAHLGLIARLPDHGVTSLLVGSTLDVYADRSGRPQTETAPLHPMTAGARAALTLERAVVELGIGDDGTTGVLRCGAAFGIDRSFGAAPLTTGRAVRALLGPLGVQLDGRSDMEPPAASDLGPRDRVGLADLARGFRLALAHLEAGRASFLANLSTGRRVDVVELANRLAESSGRRVLPEPSDDPGRPAGDSMRARQLLGWRAEGGAQALVADLVAGLSEQLPSVSSEYGDRSSAFG